MQIGRPQYKYVLCDIDGTLANLEHRLHHVREKPKNWPAFFREIPNDSVIWPVYTVIEALRASKYSIILVSGRGEEERVATENWLKHHQLGYDELLMRAAKDYRADEIVKREIFERRFSAGERKYVLGIFDDRPKVIRMWKEIGVMVFNVGDGKEF